MKIVILDDSTKTRVVIESFLEDFGVQDSEVFLYENGYEALDFIKQNGVDIIFSNINMPYMSGFEFAELVFKVLPDLKSSFFAISGDENRDNYIRMEKIGVHRFLKKPINYEHFKNCILPEVLKHRYIENNLSFSDTRALLKKM